MSIPISEIDFSRLLDVRLDYLFKLIFGNDAPRLISLINAIFANKRIDRVITDLAFINTALEKQSEIDKFSIIDMMATLSDGSTACIEVHLYGLSEFKYKSLRTWAKVYGEGLRESQMYWENRPVICISFLDGAIKDATGEPLKAVHTLFQVRERDGHELLLRDMELHYINMRAFVKEYHSRETPPDMFSRWLTLITQSEQSDKGILKEICKEDEVIAMTVGLLASLSEDQATRLAYSRRKDAITHYYAAVKRSEENERLIEEYSHQLDDERRRSEEYRNSIEKAIKAMQAKNWTVTEISKALELSEEEIKKYL